MMTVMAMAMMMMMVMIIMIMLERMRLYDKRDNICLMRFVSIQTEIRIGLKKKKLELWP